MAINSTIIQHGGEDVIGGSSLSVGGASEIPWSTPTSGNILVAVLSVANYGGAGSSTLDDLSGWTTLQSGANAEFDYRIFVKVSAGNESTVTATFTLSHSTCRVGLSLSEWDATDLDTTIGNWQSAANNSSMGTDAASLATAAVTNTTPNSLVLYLWPFKDGGALDSRTYSVGAEQYTHRLQNTFRPASSAASQVVSTTASRSSTLSEATGLVKMAGVTLVIPAAAAGTSITATDGTVQIGEAGLTHAPVAAGTEVFTASPAFSSAINGATLDPDGAAIDITSLLSSLSTTNATLTAPDVSLFRVGGAWNAIRWGVDYVIRFTDGTDTADVNCKFTAPVPTRFGAIVTPNATYHPGAAIATDESYGLFTVGEGTHDPADGDTTANIFVAGVATFQPFAYDLSAGNWIEGTAVPFADGAIPECPQQLSNSVLGPLHSPVENFTCLRTY